MTTDHDSPEQVTVRWHVEMSVDGPTPDRFLLGVAVVGCLLSVLSVLVGGGLLAGLAVLGANAAFIAYWWHRTRPAAGAEEGAQDAEA